MDHINQKATKATKVLAHLEFVKGNGWIFHVLPVMHSGTMGSTVT
jgi:hypothetical protein